MNSSSVSSGARSHILALFKPPISYPSIWRRLFFIFCLDRYPIVASVTGNIGSAYVELNALHVRLPTGALPQRLRGGDYFCLLFWLALF